MPTATQPIIGDDTETKRVDLERRRLEFEGARLADLVVGWEWIDRRVECATCIDDVEARREVSVTFTLPHDLGPIVTPQPPSNSKAPASETETQADGTASSDHAQADVPLIIPGHTEHFYYVPLTVIGKEELTRFDFIDGSGRSLPLLTAHEKGSMGAGLLIKLAEDVLAKDGPEGEALEIDGHVEEELRKIARGPTDEALELWRNFQRPRENEGIYKVLQGKSDAARLLRALVYTLTFNYLVVVPIRSRPGAKGMVKFSYNEHVRKRYRELKPMRVPPPFLDGILRSIGWKSKQFWFPTPAIGQGGSYHFEIAAPPGLKVTKARLMPMAKDADGKWTQLGAGANHRGLRSRPSERQQPHVFYRDAPAGAFGMVHAKIRARGSTIIRAAWFLAVGVAIMLLIGHHYLAQLLTGNEGDGDGAAAVLLIGPTAASVYISRSSEHEMTTFVLFGIRLLALLAGVASFVAACLIVLGEDSKTTHIAWLACMWMAIGVAATLSATAVSTWRDDDTFKARWQRYWSKPPKPTNYPPPPA